MAAEVFPESKLAHYLLDGLEGIEIGPASHNPFGLKTRFVSLSRDDDPVSYDLFEQEQIRRCGHATPIDLVADAASLPLDDDETFFVLHSHVWEHLPNPLGALEDWVRVVRPGGFIFCIVPTRNAAPSDQARPLTDMDELLEHHRRRSSYVDRNGQIAGPSHAHYTVFSPALLREIAAWFNRNHRAQLVEIAFQEQDDKVGNGHTIVWQVEKGKNGGF